MTDEESRKAFEEWAGPYCAHYWAEREYAQRAWQAAVEWATKRERERCLSLAHGSRFGALDPDIRTLIYFIDQGLRLPSIEIAEGEEPKP